MILGKKFSFDAAHKLPNNEKYGKCAKLHGHTYELIIKVEGPVNDDGWVINFTNVKAIVKDNIIEKLDHSFLNDFIPVPTAENISIYIFKQLDYLFSKQSIMLSSVIVYESKDNFVECKKEDANNDRYSK